MSEEKKIKLSERRLVGRTHFRKKPTKDQGWQWFWSTMTPNERDTIGVGGEGYHNLDGAINGYLSQQGIPDWEAQQAMPDGYRKEKIDPQHYVIIKFAKVEIEENIEKGNN